MTDKEQLLETDKLQLDLHKASLRQAQTDMQLAQVNAQLVQTNYQQFLANLSSRYKLGEGDTIQVDGTIVRKPVVVEIQEEKAE